MDRLGAHKLSSYCGVCFIPLLICQVYKVMLNALNFTWGDQHSACIGVAPAWPQLQSGGAGCETEEAGGDVSVGGVPGEQVSLSSLCQRAGWGQV